MKKRSLALLATLVLAIGLTACGEPENETVNNDNDEPVMESTTEPSAEPTETPTPELSEEPASTDAPTPEASEDIVSADTPSAEETPAAESNALPYSIEFVYCNEDSKNLEYVTSVTDTYLLQAIAPYVIVTNTSNSTYRIEIEGIDYEVNDRYFEPGEQLRTLAVLGDFEEDDNLDSVDMTTAYTLADGEKNIIYAWSVDIDVNEEPDEDFYTRGMFTITQADVISTEESNEFVYIDYNVPAELESIESCKTFVVFYDEAGTEIGCLEGNYRTGSLEYHEIVSNWASADIYYRYE